MASKNQLRKIINKKYIEILDPNFYRKPAKKFSEFLDKDLFSEFATRNKIVKWEFNEQVRYYLIKNHILDLNKVLITNTHNIFFILKLFYYLKSKFYLKKLYKLIQKKQSLIKT